MRINLILLIIFILGSCRQKQESIQLPFYNTPDFTPEWTADHARILHTIGSFSLIDQEGKSFGSRDVKGKIYVANFFFSTCGSICPRMMQHLKKLQNSFPTTELMILSHTVMPGTDSVARLKWYEQKMGIDGRNWRLLTGNEKEIYDLARQSYFAEGEQGMRQKPDEFLHTENCLLIDRQGRIRGVYNGTLELEIDKLIEHIKILEKEDRL